MLPERGPAHWDPSHRLRGSSEPPPKSPIPPAFDHLGMILEDLRPSYAVASVSWHVEKTEHLTKHPAGRPCLVLGAQVWVGAPRLGPRQIRRLTGFTSQASPRRLRLTGFASQASPHPRRMEGGPEGACLTGCPRPRPASLLEPQAWAGLASVPHRARFPTQERRQLPGREAVPEAGQHGQSALLGSAPARLLCLLSARLVALGSSALPG